MARKSEIVQRELDKIAKLESEESENAVVEPEPDEEVQTSEEVEESEATGEDDEPVDVFGVKMTKADFERLVEADKNISGMVAAHTRRSQELADERRRLEAAKEEVAKQLGEVERLREIASTGGADAVHSYLVGEELPEESRMAQELSEIKRQLSDLANRESVKEQEAAVSEVRAFIRNLVSEKDIFADAVEMTVPEIQNLLFVADGVDGSNWREKAKEIVEKKASVQERLIQRRIESLAAKKKKGTRATVPPSEGAPAPKPAPRGKGKSWVKGMEGKEVDFDSLTSKAEKWLREVGGMS